MSSRWSNSRTARKKSSRMGMVRAFFRIGRLSVIQAMGPVSETISSGSLTTAPSPPGRRWPAQIPPNAPSQSAVRV